MNDRRSGFQYQGLTSPPGYSHESCSTPVFNVGWGYQAQPQQQASSLVQDDAFDVFADPEFKAWIANTICTPPRPMRASSSDPLASPVSPGNWMLSMPSASSSTPFSPAQATYGLHTRAPQHQLPSHLHQLESVHTGLPGKQQTPAAPSPGQMPEQYPPLRRSASLDYPLPLHLPESSMTCQTPVQQQRHLTGSLSDLGQYVASSANRAAAPINALPRPIHDPRATALRRASNRIPKRSLDEDFELTQAITNPKGSAGARRGPTGPSKVRKATFTATAASIPQNEGKLSKGGKPNGTSPAGASICGLMSPFSLLKPFGDSGKGSLAELNKLIQESAEKPQTASSSDNSDAGSSGQITMSRLAKGVPVPGASSKR